MKNALPNTLGETLATGLARRMSKQMAESTVRIIKAGNNIPVNGKSSRYLSKVRTAIIKIKSPWKLHGPSLDKELKHNHYVFIILPDLLQDGSIKIVMKIWGGDGRCGEQELPLRITLHALARAIQTLGYNPKTICELLSALLEECINSEETQEQNLNLVHPHPHDQESDVLSVINRDENGQFILRTVIKMPHEGGSGWKAKIIEMMHERGIESFVKT